ncbi:MAG TPA: NAD(P)H-flavin reductase [Idiomarina baltica]|uniref:NAD(P)H-flavin reductase n=1 Tax=Idiomarina baltica TaxID=190892 RepID=A0A348WMV0_9GAMM|nr:NAD(P)H-flavin reductase [Idiomarina baltica]|tara:strand:- start:66 stop:767 length:702 start_codon:yes stop_codon:yes gene_type:complete
MSQVMHCKAHVSRQLAEHVWEVSVTLPEATKFEAGQYLMVVMGERDKRPFSIASAPTAHKEWLLHIGAPPDNSYATEVLDVIKDKGELTIEAPAGEAVFKSDRTGDTVLIAGGTGFSYTYSILQKLLTDGLDKPVYFYWGAKSADDLYLHEELQALATQHPLFTYHPVVEEAPQGWAYGVGLVHHEVMAQQPNLSECQIYMAGRFEMVRVIRDDFTARDVPMENMHGDALAFI